MSLPPQNNLVVKYYYYFFKAHQHKAAGRKNRLDIQNYIIIILLLLLLLFACKNIKQTTIQQSITWSNMLNRTDRNRSALTVALNKIEISVKPN